MTDFNKIDVTIFKHPIEYSVAVEAMEHRVNGIIDDLGNKPLRKLAYDAGMLGDLRIEDQSSISAHDGLSAKSTQYATSEVELQKRGNEAIWLLEHFPVYTAGTGVKASDLICCGEVPIHKTSRGGQCTYHGPGQRVIYTIINLKRLQSPDIKLFVKLLESTMIEALNFIGIDAFTVEGRPGVWTYCDQQIAKIGFIGLRVRKWVTYHGMAINYNPDLNCFNKIIPCGIKDCKITSLEKLQAKYEAKTMDALIVDILMQKLSYWQML